MSTIYTDNSMIDVGNLRKNLAKKIKIERVKLEISQEELAERANLHRTTLSKIERSLMSPSIETLAMIANALDLTMGELFDFNF